ncbi:hypothetical protein CC86DRAFT_376068 [Ophiobolus disseminans]|uniref:EGF-like domain-containing protein n=1 Tax=Ophiobolus disseminans TaxID=1469910 RepID=A0A6A7AHL0_9PLEO|nr:hypothetical protein CC86DRAFT_376068 [Ophiobolus disseminans]
MYFLALLLALLNTAFAKKPSDPQHKCGWVIQHGKIDLFMTTAENRCVPHDFPITRIKVFEGGNQCDADKMVREVKVDSGVYPRVESVEGRKGVLSYRCAIPKTSILALFILLTTPSAKKPPPNLSRCGWIKSSNIPKKVKTFARVNICLQRDDPITSFIVYKFRGSRCDRNERVKRVHVAWDQRQMQEDLPEQAGVLSYRCELDYVVGGKKKPRPGDDVSALKPYRHGHVRYQSTCITTKLKPPNNTLHTSHLHLISHTTAINFTMRLLLLLVLVAASSAKKPNDPRRCMWLKHHNSNPEAEAFPEGNRCSWRRDPIKQFGVFLSCRCEFYEGNTCDAGKVVSTVSASRTEEFGDFDKDQQVMSFKCDSMIKKEGNA